MKITIIFLNILGVLFATWTIYKISMSGYPDGSLTPLDLGMNLFENTTMVFLGLAILNVIVVVIPNKKT